MIRHTIFSSDGMALNFPDEELYLAYLKVEKALYLSTYRVIRRKYGIWASNQNRFVSSPEMLNNFDNKVMEDLHKSLPGDKE